VTFGFRRRPSVKGLGVLALVVLAVLVIAGLLGKAGSSGGSGGSGGGAQPAPGSSGVAPTRGPDGAQAAGEWTFDEGAGRAAADTAGGSPMALQPGADWVADGQDGSAVRFDGTARGYGETSRPVLDTTASYTVTAWVRLDRVPDGFATAVSEDAGADSAFALQYAPSGAWAMSAGGTRALSHDPPVRGQWTHLAGVRDTSTGQLTLYVDGVKQNSVPYALQPAATGSFAVGRGLSGGRKVDFLPGSIDGVHAYEGVLTDEEIRSVYQSGH
jgi:Concanavalin A-like lectin/glucanases superfamily